MVVTPWLVIQLNGRFNMLNTDKYTCTDNKTHHLPHILVPLDNKCGKTHFLILLYKKIFGMVVVTWAAGAEEGAWDCAAVAERTYRNVAQEGTGMLPDCSHTAGHNLAGCNRIAGRNPLAAAAVLHIHIAGHSLARTAAAGTAAAVVASQASEEQTHIPESSYLVAAPALGTAIAAADFDLLPELPQPRTEYEA